MKFIEKSSNTTFIIKLNVKTNCKTQKVIVNEDFLTIFLRSKPIQNKANKELFNLFKTRLNMSSNQIQIITGSKSNNKIIKLNFSENTKEKEIIDKLLI
ncbi:MAG: DUF167 domain-containing protein [Candidatus Lokiarchaeia archaeon]|nr:DUF167 domain-containing protein [Candidatus Lokiarchaeia archaeon]